MNLRVYPDARMVVGQKCKKFYPIIFPHTDFTTRWERRGGKKSSFYKNSCFLNVFISLTSNIMSQDINNFYQMEKEFTYTSLRRNTAQYAVVHCEELKSVVLIYLI